MINKLPNTFTNPHLSNCALALEEGIKIANLPTETQRDLAYLEALSALCKKYEQDFNISDFIWEDGNGV